MNKIHTSNFYGSYYGHYKYYLETLEQYFRENGKSIIYLAGDSSLDNKHWIKIKNEDSYTEAVNGYENILSPPRMLPDVSYHMNYKLKSSNYSVLNCAIEESTINERKKNLLIQDTIIRDTITKDDILIISVGGNDIALKRTWFFKKILDFLCRSTVFNMILLMKFNSLSTLQSGKGWGHVLFHIIV
jgi:hypothetical protein